MKKLISLLLVLVIGMSFGTPAFAFEGIMPVESTV